MSTVLMMLTSKDLNFFEDIIKSNSTLGELYTAKGLFGPSMKNLGSLQEKF
jgi:hypothetical protein